MRSKSPMISGLLPPHARLPKTLLRFLNTLPASGDASVWVTSFADLLRSLFDDVHLVVVRVNLHCRLIAHHRRHTASSRASVDLLARAVTGGASSPAVPLDVVAPIHDSARYHPPSIFEYSYCGDDLGTITLFRARNDGAQQVGEETLTAMQSLEPFLVFVLTDLVARYSFARPMSRAFHDVLREVAAETSLTKRELEVLTFHMFGRKYDEIATRLHISIDTVKKHVKKIHRKTGARSATELFARYFAPLVDDGALE